MNSSLRCPNCHDHPKVSTDDNGVVLQCEIHGHMALGYTLEKAITHWNRYVQGLITRAPESLRKPNQTEIEKIIHNALFGISPKEDN